MFCGPFFAFSTVQPTLPLTDIRPRRENTPPPFGRFEVVPRGEFRKQQHEARKSSLLSMFCGPFRRFSRFCLSRISGRAGRTPRRRSRGSRSFHRENSGKSSTKPANHRFFRCFAGLFSPFRRFSRLCLSRISGRAGRTPRRRSGGSRSSSGENSENSRLRSADGFPAGIRLLPPHPPPRRRILPRAWRTARGRPADAAPARRP